MRVRRDGRDGSLLLGEHELYERNYAEIEVASALTMVDLRNDSAIRMGVPTDVARSSAQSLARRWSLAWYEHAARPDGIIYPSRLNGQTNLAVYHRAVPKLRADGARRLIRAGGLAAVLVELLVELAPSDPAA